MRCGGTGSTGRTSRVGSHSSGAPPRYAQFASRSMEYNEKNQAPTLLMVMRWRPRRPYGRRLGELDDGTIPILRVQGVEDRCS